MTITEAPAYRETELSSGGRVLSGKCDNRQVAMVMRLIAEFRKQHEQGGSRQGGRE